MYGWNGTHIFLPWHIVDVAGVMRGQSLHAEYVELLYVLRVYEDVISAGYYILVEQVTEDFVNDWKTADAFAMPYGITWYS